MRETNNRGVAQLASASGLGPEGPVFESQYPDSRGWLKSHPLFLCIFLWHQFQRNANFVTDSKRLI